MQVRGPPCERGRGRRRRRRGRAYKQPQSQLLFSPHRPTDPPRDPHPKSHRTYNRSTSPQQGRPVGAAAGSLRGTDDPAAGEPRHPSPSVGRWRRRRPGCRRGARSGRGRPPAAARTRGCRGCALELLFLVRCLDPRGSHFSDTRRRGSEQLHMARLLCSSLLEIEFNLSSWAAVGEHGQNLVQELGTVEGIGPDVVE